MRLHKWLGVAVAILLLTRPASAGTIVFEVEKNHSSISFAISIAAGMSKVRGQFSDYSVRIVLDEDDITNSSVEVRIQVISINTGIQGRDADLQKPIFFDTVNYREITFLSTSIERNGENYIATGEFTMKGISRTIKFPFVLKGLDRLAGDKPVIGISATITVDRLEYGVGNDFIHRTIPFFLADDVQIEIDMWTRIGKRQ